MTRTKQKEDYKQVLLLLFLSLLCIVGCIVTIAIVTDNRDSGENHSSETLPTENEEWMIDKTMIFQGGGDALNLSKSASTATAGAEISSKQIVLVNGETGEIIAQKNDDETFSPASLTKVMTLIVLTERLTEADLDRKIELTAELTDYVKSGNYRDASVSLVSGDKYTGDTYTIRDLLYGVGVASAADCVILLVHDVCHRRTIRESEELFAAWMNQKAAELGLQNTHFDNAIGYESSTNYTTASEMAVIMAYAMKCPLIADILGTSEYTGKGNYFKNGEPATYNLYFENTFFIGRMKTFKDNTGKSFTLPNGWSVTEAKTGSFDTTSFLVCELKKDGSETPYYLVLGAAERSSYPASVYTLTDIQTIVKTYLS